MKARFDDTQSARDAAYEVGPRVYTLSGIKDEPLRFFVIGCHGSGKESQHRTAQLMNEVMRDLSEAGEPLPQFVTFLGDNIYDDGVESPYSQKFKECFSGVYKKNEYTFLNKLACFFLLGNHDHKYHAHATAENLARYYAWLALVKQGKTLALNQVAHTYFVNHEEGINTRKELFTRSELNVNELSDWNMPYFYYSVVAGNTQIFFLDSNTYLHDYLDLINPEVELDEIGYNKETGEINQAFWFEQENKKAQKEGRQIIIAQHHPLFVAGKRSFPNKYDSGHYLTEEQMKLLNEDLRKTNALHVNTQSFNELLALVYHKQGVKHDAVLAAHEHFMSYHNDTQKEGNKLPLRQVTSGGGGGPLHPRCSFRAHPYVGMHQQHNGVALITVGSKQSHDFEVDFYTVDNLHLKFNQNSAEPVRLINQDGQVEALRKAIINACDLYFASLRDAEVLSQGKPQQQDDSASNFKSFLYGLGKQTYYAYQNAKHFFKPDKQKQLATGLVHDIQALFNQHKLPDFQTCVTKLYELSMQLPYRGDGTALDFYSLMDKCCTESAELNLSISTLFRSAGLQPIIPNENNNNLALNF